MDADGLDEVHIILRFDNHEMANELTERMGDGATECFQLEFYDDRCGVMHFDGSTTECKLIDLPCVTECYKTLNNSCHFKIGNISQILFVGAGAHALADQHSDGLTPSSKGIQTHWDQKDSIESVSPTEIDILRDSFMKIIETEDDDMLLEVLSVPENATDEEILAGCYNGNQRRTPVILQESPLHPTSIPHSVQMRSTHHNTVDSSRLSNNIPQQQNHPSSSLFYDPAQGSRPVTAVLRRPDVLQYTSRPPCDSGTGDHVIHVNSSSSSNNNTQNYDYYHRLKQLKTEPAQLFHKAVDDSRNAQQQQQQQHQRSSEVIQQLRSELHSYQLQIKTCNNLSLKARIASKLHQLQEKLKTMENGE
jgi:hypothetical protein